MVAANGKDLDTLACGQRVAFRAWRALFLFSCYRLVAAFVKKRLRLLGSRWSPRQEFDYKQLLQRGLWRLRVSGTLHSGDVEWVDSVVYR